MTTQSHPTMTEEEKNEAWLADAEKLCRAELLDVLDKWQQRAKPYGFTLRPPPLDNSHKSELAAYALKARKHYRDVYIGKLPQALDKFAKGCVAFLESKEILESNGHHFGLFSDIEPLVDQLSKQLADLAAKQP